MVRTATELERDIDTFIAQLEKGIRLEAVILFGSYVRGTAGEDSDVDLAIISPDFEGVAINKRQSMIARLSVRRPWNLSPIGYPSSAYHNPEPNSFLGEIVRTGRVVYPRP